MQREWRKNPDSDRRERHHRLRDESKWIGIDVPDLRNVRREITARKRSSSDNNPARSRRRKHLLSGLIKCAECGANYRISGRNYYRCAGVKERATCTNRVSIRVAQIERATLSVHQHQLLTEDHARVFVETFRSAAARLLREQQGCDTATQERLTLVTAELTNLEQNMLSGVLSPTLLRLLTEREAEKTRLDAQLAIKLQPAHSAAILPHPVLPQRFEANVHDLRAALNDGAIRDADGKQVIRLVLTEGGGDGVIDAIAAISENDVAEKASAAFKHITASAGFPRMLTGGIDLKSVTSTGWTHIQSETGQAAGAPKMGLLAWNYQIPGEVLAKSDLSKAGISLLVKDAQSEVAPGLEDVIRNKLTVENEMEAGAKS